MLRIARIARHRHRLPREDPRKDVGVSGEDVGVGVVECGLTGDLVDQYLPGQAAQQQVYDVEWRQRVRRSLSDRSMRRPVLVSCRPAQP